jgi:PAS domain S-box-containing protein
MSEQKRDEEELLRYLAILECCDDAIIAKNLDGVILSWNAAAQRIFGYAAEEAIGQSITIIIPPELRDEEVGILSRLKAGERIEHCETLRITKDGRRLNVSITASPIRDAEGRIIGASKIARDITERKLAEAVLRESEERFRLVANTAPVMIWMSGLDKLCNYANQPSIEFIGRSAEAILGNGWAEGIHPDDLERSWDIYSNAFDRHEPFRMEYRLRGNDGEYHWVIDSGVPRFNADGSFAGYIGSAIDVTEQKLAADVLSTVSQRLIEAQEEERSWIARELHDDIGQRLALLKWQLDQKQHSQVSADQLQQKIDEASKVVEDLAVDIQALSHRLHSPKLKYLGLAEAVASLCEELSEGQGVEIQFQSESVPKDLPTEAALCLFRVSQEALKNAIKHSGSRHFRVSLIGGQSQIDLSVRDSGSGFDAAEAMNGRGLGLTSMRERLKLAHGELSIESQPGKGTTVHARVPVSPKKIAAGAAG